jgi:hypothetical protein
MFRRRSSEFSCVDRNVHFFVNDLIMLKASQPLVCRVHLAKSINVPARHFDEQYSTTFAELRDQLKTTYSGLDYTILLKRFNVGQATLRVLNIARRLAKGPENAHLRSHIDAMEKALQHRRNNKKQVEPPLA